MIRGTSAGFWIPKALERAGCRILVDTHLAQWSAMEVLRKLVSGPIPCAGLERLREDYGLTPRDWEGLRPKCCDYREDACYAQAEAALCTGRYRSEWLCRYPAAFVPVWLHRRSQGARPKVWDV